MPEKSVTLSTSQGTKYYKITESGGKHYAYRDGSEIGSAATEDGAINVIKSHAGGTVHKVSLGEPSSGCFPAATRILTPIGYKDIDEFQLGDDVLSWSLEQATIVKRPVTRVRKRPPVPIWRLTFDDFSLRTNGHHTILTHRGWLRVDRIAIQDSIARLETFRRVGFATLREVTIEPAEDVFNLYTAGEHNFIAEGVIAHNFTVLRTTRTLLHRLFRDGALRRGPVASPAEALATPTG